MNFTRCQPPRKRATIKGAILWIAFFGLLFKAHPVSGAELSMPEYQVKALFLLNFTKYVDWPPASFATANSPIIIGLCGEDRFGDALNKAVAGKTISGRPIRIQPVGKDSATEKCQILFIGDSDKKRVSEILGRIKALPVLTVGEVDQFLEQGGVINFVKKEEKIRLEINLDAARQAGLQISSKLLNVADVVKGKLK